MIRRVSILIICLLTLSTNVQSNNFDNWKDLKSLAYLNSSNQTLMRSSYCPYNCRFDRTSSGDTRYLRNEGNESVIFEDINPGVITRLWMTAGSGTSDPLDPNINIKFYFDGEDTARIDVPLPEFFNGSTPPFIQPLTADRLVSSGGNFTYHPFPYAKSLKITLTDSIDYRIWYQINYERVDKDTSLITFSIEDDINQYAELINKAGNTLWGSNDSTFSDNISLNPGGEIEILNLNSGGWVKDIKLALNETEYEKVKIKFNFDGNETIDLFLNEYFSLGSNNGVKTRSLYLGLNEQNELYSYFPMPYKDNVSIKLVADSTLASSVDINYAIGVDNDVPNQEFGYLSTQKFDTCPTTPLIDTPFLSVSGRGKWVGIFADYSSIGTTVRSYLEGDERIFIDWDQHPTLFGTGTEDIYNGGFYFDQGNFSLPLHGSTYHNIISPEKSVTSAYRFMLADSIEFQASIQAGLESGPFGDLPMCSKTIAYYYQANSKYELISELNLNSQESMTKHEYKNHETATSSNLTATFLDEPPTALTTKVTEFTKHASSFSIENPNNFTNLRIKRLIDNHIPNQAAEVFVNGELMGEFSYVPEKPQAYQPANPDRRWVEESLDIDSDWIDALQFVIKPKYSNNQNENQTFREAKYQLFGIRQEFLEIDTLSDDVSLNACTSDSNDCSLRGAISKLKNSQSTGSLKLSVAGKIVLTNGAILIENDINISGSKSLDISIDTKIAGRHFNIVNDSKLKLENLGLTNSSDLENSGGIYLSQGELTLNNVKVDNGRSPVGANLYINQGKAQIIRSKIQNGKSSSGGSAIHQNSGELLIYKSSIFGNEASNSSSIVQSNGTVQLNNSSVYGNIASNGNVLNISSEKSLIENSIIANNQSKSILSVSTGSEITIKNSTIYNNSLNQFAIELEGGSLELTHNLIANNKSSDHLNNCKFTSGEINSLGFNLIQNAGTCLDHLVSSDIKPSSQEELPILISELNTEQALPKYVVHSNSPLIDSGIKYIDDLENLCSTIDINDSIRAINGKGGELNCDIGAVEFVDKIHKGTFEFNN